MNLCIGKSLRALRLYVSGSIGPGDGQYVGLDQFGRVVNRNWVNAYTGTSVDNCTYSHDADGNVTAKNNVLDPAYSEAYAYDNLNRLTSTTRNGTAYQSWNLDSQGNWSGFTNQGSTQTETANSQNQITSISGQTTPTYDANGNMTQDQNGNTLVYDPWNRLVEVKNASGVVIAQYSYNAQNYAVTVSYPQGGSGVPPLTTNYIYYDNQWQVIEVRTDGTAAANVSEQMAWSAAYVNAAVLQDTYSNGVIEPDGRLYFLQDADWNTTAVVGYDPSTQAWSVVQRFVYDSYGNVTILNADWSATPSGTQPMVNSLYQGMQFDPITGLYYGRARWYSPSLGRWISQDPAGYVNGANAYQFVGGGPVTAVDPVGLSRYPGPQPPVWGPGKVTGRCPTLTLTAIGSLDLGDIVVPGGVNPTDAVFNRVLQAVLAGLSTFSELGKAIAGITTELSGAGEWGELWHGRAVLTMTQTGKCKCNGQVQWSRPSVTSSTPTWAEKGFVLMTPDAFEQDSEFVDLLKDILGQIRK